MKKTLLLFVGLLSTVSALRAQDKILWGDQNADFIYKANSDLTTPESMTDVQNPNGIAWVNTESTYKLFYAISFYIYRSTPNGSDAGDIVNTNPDQFNRGIAIDYLAKKVYWANQLKGTIERANLDGTGAEPVLTGLTAPWDIELDLVNQKIYWTEDDANGKINRANLSDGSNKTPLISGVDALGVAVDPARNKIFYTDFANKKVFAASLADGSGATAIISTAITTAADIDVDYATGKIYYTDYGANRIKRFNADGTGGKDMVGTGLFIEYADMTAPSVASITRQSPATEEVEEGTDVNVTFRVTFSEPVLNIGVADFSLAAPLTGDITVNHVSEYKVYDVVVSNISATGVLNLNLAGNTDLLDFRGNGFSGTISSEETFTIKEATAPPPPPPVTAIETGAAEAQVFLQPGEEPGSIILHTQPVKGSWGKVTIYDATGTTVHAQEMQFSESVELYTDHYHTGLYVIRLTAAGKRYTQKVVIRD